MCMQEHTTSGFADMTIEHGPADFNTSLPLPAHMVCGVVCQACHDLFRACMLHPHTARWQVLGNIVPAARDLLSDLLRKLLCRRFH